jgi:hypothetical protein
MRLNMRVFSFQQIYDHPHQNNQKKKKKTLTANSALQNVLKNQFNLQNFKHKNWFNKRRYNS